MRVIHEVNRQVVETRHHQPISREVRHAHGWQVADSLLADDDVSGQRFGVCLLLIDDREILIRHQLTPGDDDELRVILINLVNQVTGGIHDQRVEVRIVAVFTHADHVGNDCAVLVGDFRHHARGRFIAVLLQPADGHILQQRIVFAVRGVRSGSTVETGHDEIQRLAFDDGVTDTGLEVLESRPQVELFVADMKVKVNLGALVLIRLQRGKVSGLTLIITGGVGSARNRTVNADANFFAFQLVDRHDVDFGQKRG